MNKELDIFQQFAKTGKQKIRAGKTQAVIYTRVSSKIQLDGASLEVQLEFCDNYAKRKNLVVVKYFGGTNESAKTDDRKEFQKMIIFAKRNKDIGYIIVYNFKRFSRTGISKTYLDLEERGIKIISATQNVDENSSGGILHKHVLMEVGRMDNEDKRKSCVHGMQKRLRKGYVTGAIPFGYTNINPGKRKMAQLVINEQGQLLKKAFELKVKYNLTHAEITKRLKIKGWTKGYKRLGEYFRNPIYCGLIVSTLIPDEIIEGKHPPLVSKETFLKVNGLLNKKNYGGKYQKEDENLPLKQFVIADSCGTKYTGYLVKKKNLYYYKNNRIGSKENQSAKKMHELFIATLSSYQLKDEKWKAPMKEMLMQMNIELHQECIDNLLLLDKKVNKIQNNLEKIERRFVLDEIERELYIKYKSEFETELHEINEEIQNSQFNLSNLENAIENVVEYALNLPNLWACADIEEKKRIQNMVFPDGIRYNYQNHSYRTDNVNFLFSAIPIITTDLAGKKNGTTSKIKKLSRFVLETGVLITKFE